MAKTAMPASVLGDEFLSIMNQIAPIRRYALTGDVLPTLKRLDSDLQKRLLSPDGLLAAQKWVRSFAESLTLLEEFRIAYLAGAEPSEDELREVFEGSTRVLAALMRRLDDVKPV